MFPLSSSTFDYVDDKYTNNNYRLHHGHCRLILQNLMKTYTCKSITNQGWLQGYMIRGGGVKSKVLRFDQLASVDVEV